MTRHQDFHDLHRSGCFAGGGAIESAERGRDGGDGVRRISTGSQIARLTHAAIRDAVTGMLRDGSFAGLKGAASGDEIDALLRDGAGI